MTFQTRYSDFTEAIGMYQIAGCKAHASAISSEKHPFQGLAILENERVGLQPRSAQAQCEHDE